MNREQLFREAYAGNSKRIFRICCYYFSNEHDRRDAYQDVLVRIWENLSGFRGDAKLSTWIYRIAVNTCLSYIRRSNRRNIIIETDNCTELQSIPWYDEGQEVRAEEMYLFFREYMNTLNSADRMLMTLYTEGLTTHEISDIIGLSESNVRVRVHRIRERIKKAWEEKHHENE